MQTIRLTWGRGGLEWLTTTERPTWGVKARTSHTKHLLPHPDVLWRSSTSITSAAKEITVSHASAEEMPSLWSKRGVRSSV
jgi:hypothetical protein